MSKTKQGNKLPSKQKLKVSHTKAEIASLVEQGVQAKLNKLAENKDTEEKQCESLKATVMGVLQEVSANISSTNQGEHKSFLTAILKKSKKE